MQDHKIIKFQLYSDTNLAKMLGRKITQRMVLDMHPKSSSQDAISHCRLLWHRQNTVSGNKYHLPSVWALQPFYILCPARQKNATGRDHSHAKSIQNGSRYWKCSLSYAFTLLIFTLKDLIYFKWHTCVLFLIVGGETPHLRWQI